VGTRETQKKKEKQGNIASLLFKKKKNICKAITRKLKEKM